MFLVWQHGRQDSAAQASVQSWYKDYNDLLALHPDNIFLVKLAYWLDRQVLANRRDRVLGHTRCSGHVSHRGAPDLHSACPCTLSSCDAAMSQS